MPAAPRRQFARLALSALAVLPLLRARPSIAEAREPFRQPEGPGPAAFMRLADDAADAGPPRLSRC